jgi:hypothetical protein
MVPPSRDIVCNLYDYDYRCGHYSVRTGVRLKCAAPGVFTTIAATSERLACACVPKLHGARQTRS